MFLGTALYTPLQDLSFTDNPNTIEIESHKIEYSYHKIPTDKTISETFISEILLDSSVKLFQYAKNKNLPIEECRYIDFLDIFKITESELNDRHRFYNYGILGKNYKVIGLFDKNTNHSKHVAIILTDQKSRQENAKLIAHEITHYWDYRFCWDLLTSFNGEALADEFTEYFGDNR